MYRCNKFVGFFVMHFSQSQNRFTLPIHTHHVDNMISDLYGKNTDVFLIDIHVDGKRNLPHCMLKYKSALALKHDSSIF